MAYWSDTIDWGWRLHSNRKWLVLTTWQGGRSEAAGLFPMKWSVRNAGLRTLFGGWNDGTEAARA